MMWELKGLSFANLVRIQADQKISFGIGTVRARVGPEAASVGWTLRGGAYGIFRHAKNLNLTISRFVAIKKNIFYN